MNLSINNKFAYINKENQLSIKRLTNKVHSASFLLTFRQEIFDMFYFDKKAEKSRKKLEILNISRIQQKAAELGSLKGHSHRYICIV